MKKFPRFGYSLRWWPDLSGTRMKVDVDDCDEMGEAVALGVATALRLGWTPRRWWQWWRWGETSPDLTEAIRWLDQKRLERLDDKLVTPTPASDVTRFRAVCEPFLSEVFVNGPMANGGYRSFPDEHPLLYESGNIQDTGLTFGDVRRLADLVRSLTATSGG